MFELEAFMIGVVIGLTSSVCGAIIDYRRSRRHSNASKAKAPGCIYIVSGALGLLGFFAIIVSFASQSIGRAMWAGAGVFVGFVGSFIVLMLMWFFFRGRNS